MLKKVMKALLVSGIYFGWAILFYCLREGWRPIDAIYFAMVTMSTVGYGDFSPKDEPGAMVNTVFFIFFGIVFVFSEVSSCVAMLMAPFFKVRRWQHGTSRSAPCMSCMCSHANVLLESVLPRLVCSSRLLVLQWVRAKTEVCFPQTFIDIDGDGGSDFAVPRGPLIYYAKNLIAPLLVTIGGQNLWAIGYARAEGWEYGRAYYHCMTTFTTVGYGDVSIQTDEGKMVAIFHILFSVSLLGSLISEVSTLYFNRALQLKRAEMLKKRLDPELIKSLDKDGSGVDKCEFVVGMLVKLEMVSSDDVAPYLKQFDALDADHSGVLTARDLESFAQATADRVSAASHAAKRIAARARSHGAVTGAKRGGGAVVAPARSGKRAGKGKRGDAEPQATTCTGSSQSKAQEQTVLEAKLAAALEENRKLLDSLNSPARSITTAEVTVEVDAEFKTAQRGENHEGDARYHDPVETATDPALQAASARLTTRLADEELTDERHELESVETQPPLPTPQLTPGGRTGVHDGPTTPPGAGARVSHGLSVRSSTASSGGAHGGKLVNVSRSMRRRDLRDEISLHTALAFAWVNMGKRLELDDADS